MKTIYDHAGSRLKNPGILFWLFYVALMVLFVLLSLSAKAQFDPFTQITDDDYPQYRPVIDGKYVVYEDRRSGGVDDLYLYNIETGEEIAITSDPQVNSRNADISGDRIVWEDDRNGNWDIYIYNISRPDLGAYPLIDFPGNQTQPAIYNDILVYVDKTEDFKSNIYMYNLTTHDLTRINENTEISYGSPDVYGNYVVYQDNSSWADIYLYNIYTKKTIKLTDDTSGQWNPTIYGNRIVWQDDRDGNWNLYMHYLNFMPGTPFENYDWIIYTGDADRTVSDADEINPQLWGDYLVFQDNRNGNWDIYLYNFYVINYGKTTPLVTENKNQNDPAISGDRIVWQDERDFVTFYDADIWMWTRPPGADLGVGITDLPDPVKVGHDLTYKIFVKNFGIEDATDVVLTDIISDDVDYLYAKSAKSGGCPRVNNTITCEIGTLANGEVDTVTVAVRPKKEGMIKNSASVTATQDDPIQENNSITVSTTVVWDFPQPLKEGYNPVIAVDRAGNAHICYLNEDNDLIYTTNRSGGWYTDTLTSSGQAGDHAIAIDGNDHVHVAYVEGERNSRKLLYVNDTSGTWTTPFVWYDDCQQCVSVGIKVDKDNYIHIGFMKSWWSGPYMYSSTKSALGLVWDSYNSGSMDVDTKGDAHFSFYQLDMNKGIMYHNNSSDYNWSPSEIVDNNWSGGQLESLVTDIAVDNENKPHISYVSNKTGGGTEDICYAYKGSNGWVNKFIDKGAFSGSWNAIATDKNNKAHMIYYSAPDDEIRYASNEDGTWKIHTLALDVGGSPYSTWCDIATDTAGYIHMVYMKDGSIAYITNKPPPPEPDIYVTPKHINFYKRHVGFPTEPEKVTVKNFGDGTLNIDDISIVRPDSVHFRISNNTCSTLSPQDTCSVDVVFDPQSAGYYQAKLKITSNDPEEPEFYVELEGAGIAPRIYDYGNTDFGTVYLGDSVVHDYIIKNTGSASLTVQLVKIEDDDAQDFQLAGLPAMPFGIDEGDSIVFQIIFKPLTTGEKSTRLKIFSNDLDPERTLTGTCVVPQFTVSGEIVIDDNTPVTDGWVLIHHWDNDEHTAWSTQNYHLQGDNNFQISMREGEVTLYVYPDEEKYPGYLKTYLGNTAIFDQATFFYLDHDTTGLKITLVPAPPAPAGDGIISGTLTENEGNSGGKMANGPCGSGKPVASAGVFLFDEADNMIAYAITNDDGEFVFENIPDGKYTFRADLAGYYMNPSNEKLTVSANDKKFNICAKAENTLITIEISNVTGLEDVNAPGAIRIFPNPARTALTVLLPQAVKGQHLTATVYNLNGKIMKHRPLQIDPQGNSAVVKVSDLKAGMYIILIKGKQVNFRGRFMKY